MKRLLIAGLLLLGILGAARAEPAIPGVKAEAAWLVRPILIRNDYGPLTRVTIDIGKVDPDDVFERNDVRLKSITFSLDGTDDLGDLQSLSLVSTDDDKFKQVRWPNNPPNAVPGWEQSVIRPVGKSQAPALEVTFPVDLPLRKGNNIFWLSARLRDSAGLSHRISGVCASIETTAGRLVPAETTARVRQRIGVALRKAGDDGVDTYAIPAIATTAKGALLAVYDMRWNYPGHDLQDHITTGLSRSTDGGKSWEPMKVIMDMGEWGGLPRDQNGCSDPGIVVDRQTGEIFCFAAWLHGNPHHHQWIGTGSAQGYEIGKSAQFMMVRSRDDGVTWTKPVNITREVKRPWWVLICPSPTQGIQLADGTLVMPVEGRDAKGVPFATLMSSRDHGATWVTGAPSFSGGSECAAVALDDGSIMLNMRDENKDAYRLYRAVYVTRDLGQSWNIHPTNLNTLVEPECNASLLRVDYADHGEKSHVLLFENPHTHANRDRTHNTLQVSFDEGRTWPREFQLPLDDGRGWAYPTLTQIDAGHIGIVYAGSQADIQFQVLSLDEVLHR